MNTICRFSLSLATAACALAAQAQVIDTYPEYSGSVTNGWNAIAQTFAAPGSELVSYQFGVAGESGQELTIGVYSWANGAPVGSALYSTTIAWPATSGDVVLSNIDVALVTGNEYGVIVNFDGFTGQSENYVTKGTNESDPNPTGNGNWSMDPSDPTQWQSIPSLDTEFRATFSSAPEPYSLAGLAIGCIALVRRRMKLKR